MTLPSSAGGAVTQTVGWFELEAPALADWLAESAGSRPKPARWSSLADAARALAPGGRVSRHAAVPVADGWSALLTDGPLGTDVGLLPSEAARDLGIQALRAVCVETGEATHPARILELYGPGGQAPLLCVRTIAAADDGGRWVFETSGEPLPFEDQDAYGRRRKADRFTGEMLYAYLRALGVPLDTEPSWTDAVVVETDER